MRSVRSVCLKNESRVPNKIRFIHKIRVQKNLVFKHQEQRIRENCEIRVPKNIRVIRIIRVQKNIE